MMLRGQGEARLECFDGFWTRPGLFKVWITHVSGSVQALDIPVIPLPTSLYVRYICMSLCFLSCSRVFHWPLLSHFPLSPALSHLLFSLLFFAFYVVASIAFFSLLSSPLFSVSNHSRCCFLLPFSALCYPSLLPSLFFPLLFPLHPSFHGFLFN